MCSGFGGGIALCRDLSAKSSPSTWGWGFVLTPSCGNALDGASVNGGPWSAAILAQELVWESVCELALLSRQGEKSANHAGPSPGSRPAALGPMWGLSAKAAKGALAAAASAVAVRAGAGLLARAVAGGPSASVVGR